MIPIKSYATFHPLKHCLLGSGFKAEWFDKLYKNDKILSPLKRIADETEEDFIKLEEILKKFNVVTYRAKLEIDRYETIEKFYRPPITPRDHFGVIGEKFYAVQYAQGYSNILKNISKDNLFLRPKDKNYSGTIDTAHIVRVGKDLFWGYDPSHGDASEYINIWKNEGFRVHLVERKYHSDAVFCVVKPGCIVSLEGIQDYNKNFRSWEVFTIKDKDIVTGPGKKFDIMKSKVKGRWWLQGEEHNDQLIEFVNTWLTEWVGYVEETVFDVNMLSINENTIICNNYNKEVFNFFKKHQVEPVVFNFRHRYFWDSGVHCITQDLYREGKMEDYFS
jgi:hypothetical protein